MLSFYNRTTFVLQKREFDSGDIAGLYDLYLIQYDGVFGNLEYEKPITFNVMPETYKFVLNDKGSENIELGILCKARISTEDYLPLERQDPIFSQDYQESSHERETSITTMFSIGSPLKARAGVSSGHRSGLLNIIKANGVEQIGIK